MGDRKWQRKDRRSGNRKGRKWRRLCSMMMALCLVAGGFGESGSMMQVQAGQILEEEEGTGEMQSVESVEESGGQPGVSEGTGPEEPAEQPGVSEGTGPEEPAGQPGVSDWTGPEESGDTAEDTEPQGDVSGNDAEIAGIQEEIGEQTGEIYAQDFEDIAEGALPQGWVFANPGNSKATAGVKVIGGNHVLVLDQSVDNGNANYNPGLSFVLPDAYDKVVFSYSIAARTPGGVLYLPSVEGMAGGQKKRLAELTFNTGGGDYIKYQTAGDNSWYTIQSYETMRWYSIQIVYDNTGDQAVYSLYIDGNPVSLEHPAPRAQGDVTGFGTTLYRKNTGLFYLDNIRMTAEMHDPVKPGDLEPETPVCTSVAYRQDFEQTDIGKMPAGWVSSNKEDSTTISVQEEAGNHMLVLEHPAVQSTSLTLRYSFADGASTDRAVLKYRVKALESSGAFYLPSFYNNSAQLVKLALNSGKLQKGSADGKSWVDIMSCDAGTWYEIELMLDTRAGVYDLYVDGQIVVSQEKPYATGEINRMAMGVYKVTANTFYVDDLEIRDYVEGEGVSFEAASYEVVKGRSLQLGLIYTPGDTSCRSASFISSDEQIATVDNLGVVTGLKEGTVTITAIPSLTALSPVTTQVTVTNVQPEKIEISPEEVSLPQGGHTFISVKIWPEDTGNQEVKLDSADKSVATIDEWGEIVAVGEGSTVIRAQSVENPAVFCEIPVTVTARNVMKRIYVDPMGDDSGEGSASRPVRTLKQAMELVRQSNQNMTGDIEVILADGYYQQTEVLALTDLDGGRNQHYVVYRHEGDGEAVIGGKRVLTGFSLYDQDKNIYVTDAPGLETRQLYVDGVRAVRARSEGGLNSPAFLLEDGVNKGYTCANQELSGYAHPEDLELVFKEQWTNPRCGVAKVETADGRVRLIMDQPGWNYVSDKGGTSASVPVYYENALELLDEPGEWYLDTHAGKLYYMPRPWEDMGQVEVTAPVLEELLTIQGRDYDHMAENIEFVGITFADTTWNRPSTEYGHADAQNNHIREHGLPDRLPDAAITVKRANSIRFLGCDFTRMGITALKMVEGVQNSPVTGNRFYDILGGAINIGDPYTNNPDNYNPADIRKLMKNCDVTNNYIHDIGVDYQSAAAVSVGFAADLELSHNEIFNIPYSAFHIGYGWAKRFDNVQKNIEIGYNFIHDLMGDGIYDGGAIYFNGNSGGSDDNYNLVTGNYIRNQMDLNAPLYADEGTTYWHWEHNVVDLSESPLWHNNASPRWMLVYVPTIEHLKVNDIYTTTDNKHVNPEAPWVEIQDIHVDPDAVWQGEGDDIIRQSGLEEVYSTLRKSQAERIHANVEQGGVSIPEGGTFRLEVSATDGKDRAVSMEHTKLGYRVKDSGIAEVSPQGVIRGIKSGITELEIYVVSNGILDMIETKLYVGDVFSRISLEGAENDRILLGETSRGFQARAWGYTDLGREVALTNVTYTVADVSIAAVTREGYITPVKAGKTTLFVTAEGEGRMVEWEFALEIEEKQEFVEDNIWEIFEPDMADKWVVEGGSLERTDGEQIAATLSKFATFTGCKYRNELLTFQMKIDANGKGGWPSIVLRAQSADKAVSGGATGYIICFGAAGLEVHRFVGSKRTVIYGSLEGYESLGGPVICPEPLTHGEEHQVQAGALTNGDSVRLLLKIDGETVFDFTDEEAEAITEPGYFGLVGRGETFTLTKDTSIPDQVEPDPDEKPDPEVPSEPGEKPNPEAPSDPGEKPDPEVPSTPGEKPGSEMPSESAENPDPVSSSTGNGYSPAQGKSNQQNTSPKTGEEPALGGSQETSDTGHDTDQVEPSETDKDAQPGTAADEIEDEQAPKAQGGIRNGNGADSSVAGENAGSQGAGGWILAVLILIVLLTAVYGYKVMDQKRKKLF